MSVPVTRITLAAILIIHFWMFKDGVIAGMGLALLAFMNVFAAAFWKNMR